MSVPVHTATDNFMGKVQFQPDKKPVQINVTLKSNLTSRLVETRIDCMREDKDIYLYYLLLTYPGKSLVFVNSIDALRRLVPIFNLLQITAFGIHAEMQQKDRFTALEGFKASTAKHAVMICSDIAARGIDIPNVDHVIHYQTPRSADMYVHRSGRTARAGKAGVSILFVAPDEAVTYKKLCSVLKKRKCRVSGYESPIGACAFIPRAYPLEAYPSSSSPFVTSRT